MTLHLQMAAAIQYIEDNLDGIINYQDLLKTAGMSASYFQKTFLILCGVTPSEYIRYRRLTMAAIDLASSSYMRVIEVALKYGYESPESFSRAFTKFHGFPPSEAGAMTGKTKQFSKISIHITREGGLLKSVVLRQEPARVLTGFHQRFSGNPDDKERAIQEEKMLTTTRGLQWYLRGASIDANTDYFVVNNCDSHSYSFCIAFDIDSWTRNNINNVDVTGVSWPECQNFQIIQIPERQCAVFRTIHSEHPIEIYRYMRMHDVPEWFRESGYTKSSMPELVTLHEGDQKNKASRYIEIAIPISMNQE